MKWILLTLVSAGSTIREVPVLFGTDRKRDAGQPIVAFGGERADALSFGLVVVSVPTGKGAERGRRFGDVWLGWVLWRALQLDRFCGEHIIEGRERVAWADMAAILVIARLIEPSSELHIAEDWYRRTGVPAERVNDDRLYRALDRLLPHKEALEAHLKARLGDLFGLDYDLLLYDVTSTYFEGQAAANRLAKRGYSRDHRSDASKCASAWS